jgi:hypothetical protein
MLSELLFVAGVRVTAVCDKYEDRAQKGVRIVEEKAGNTPAMYLDYKDLMVRDDIEGVLCCTTWITHARIAVDAMRAGKHVAIEVGGAASLEECWQMVRASEETGKFCMLLENCCYDRNELSLFNMVKRGLFGEIVHVQGGYQHDLRDEIGFGDLIRHGRLKNFMNRNGDLYPTPQLGPLSKILGINRGNRFVSLSSMASKARGLHEWMQRDEIIAPGLLAYDVTEQQAEDNLKKYASFSFAQGDVVTTMIKCAHGETIHLIQLLRPCRVRIPGNCRIQGTKVFG